MSTVSFSHQEIPFIIDADDVRLYGIYRGPSQPDVIVLMIPFIAPGGTREGTQRLYVEASRAMASDEMGVVTVEFPPYSNSFDKNPVDHFPSSELCLVGDYLDITTGFVRDRFGCQEFVLLSTSGGCIPMYNYARLHGIRRAIMLSPYEYEADAEQIRDYLRLSFAKSQNTILQFERMKESMGLKGPFEDCSKELDLLIVFAGRDPLLERSEKFWEQCELDDTAVNITRHWIGEANHSFFGWQFKREITATIKNWLTK